MSRSEWGSELHRTKQAYVEACGKHTDTGKVLDSRRQEYRETALAFTEVNGAEVARLNDIITHMVADRAQAKGIKAALEAALEAARKENDGFKTEIAGLRARSAARIAWIQTALDADRAQALDRDRRTAGLMAASRAAGREAASKDARIGVAAAELRAAAADARAAAAERVSTDAISRLAERDEVEVIFVETNQTERVVRQDAEPAAKRLKRLEEGSLELQAQAAKAQVRVKQEKAEVTEQLEDTQDNYQMQINFTDKQQTMVDEMAKLALAHGASLSDVNKIRRPA